MDVAFDGLVHLAMAVVTLAVAVVVSGNEGMACIAFDWPSCFPSALVLSPDDMRVPSMAAAPLVFLKVTGPPPASLLLEAILLRFAVPANIACATAVVLSPVSHTPIASKLRRFKVTGADADRRIFGPDFDFDFTLENDGSPTAAKSSSGTDVIVAWTFVDSTVVEVGREPPMLPFCGVNLEAGDEAWASDDCDCTLSVTEVTCSP
jgi:hypothetical protein